MRTMVIQGLGHIRRAIGLAKSRPFISHRKKYIYIPIPKVATTSMKMLLFEYEGIPISNTVHETRYPECWHWGMIQRRDYFKFGIVRNPYSRLYSCYRSKIKQQPITNANFKNGVAKSIGIHKGLFWKGMSFDDFVRSVCRIPDWVADDHIKSQHLLLYWLGHRRVDFVGRLESLEHDCRYIFTKIGIGNVEIPHLQKGSHSSFQQHYTTEIAELVANRYSRDFASFGYGKTFPGILEPKIS